MKIVVEPNLQSGQHMYVTQCSSAAGSYYTAADPMSVSLSPAPPGSAPTSSMLKLKITVTHARGIAGVIVGIFEPGDAGGRGSHRTLGEPGGGGAAVTFEVALDLRHTGLGRHATLGVAGVPVKGRFTILDARYFSVAVPVMFARAIATTTSRPRRK